MCLSHIYWFLHVPFLQICTVPHAPLGASIRPNQSEQRTHAAVLRHQFGLDCQLEYRSIPVCSGHTDEGAPIIELVEWPFVMPCTLATGLCILKTCFQKHWIAFRWKHIPMGLSWLEDCMILPVWRSLQCWKMASWSYWCNWTSWKRTGLICWRSTLAILWHLWLVQLRLSASMESWMDICFLIWGFDTFFLEMLTRFFTGQVLKPVRRALFVCISAMRGDEGQALGGTYMAFHFQSDLSPFIKNAGASRFLITTIPSTFYAPRSKDIFVSCASFFDTGNYSKSDHFGIQWKIPTPKKSGMRQFKAVMWGELVEHIQVYDGAINVTLQAAARVICESLNRLSDSGVPIPGYDDVAEPWFWLYHQLFVLYSYH